MPGKARTTAATTAGRRSVAGSKHRSTRALGRPSTWVASPATTVSSPKPYVSSQARAACSPSKRTSVAGAIPPSARSATHQVVVASPVNPSRT